ncbi:hypothetical protein P154DRAFT_195835 [Amniculicola lignicola CBS 123094]|uniref:Uncharacterized protein n=1 Tax=Amniculicola lignicola CBS 123094 TaxID=1392246 RepID=A0A6A5WGF2_9PLEO|nr:hypothetical protein P154DRAFT_195835 [Amniculicola lignicola CBS 123094]
MSERKTIPLPPRDPARTRGGEEAKTISQNTRQAKQPKGLFKTQSQTGKRTSMIKSIYKHNTDAEPLTMESQSHPKTHTKTLLKKSPES